MFIQGEELIAAAGNGDTTTVEMLLKGNPHLVNYKGSVRRVEIRSNPIFHIKYKHVYAPYILSQW